MISRVPPGLQVAILVAVGGIGLYLFANAFADTTLLRLVYLAVIAVIVWIGATTWRERGHDWPAIASWLVPLVLWSLFAGFLAGSDVIALAAGAIGTAFLLTMLGSERAAELWVTFVLRRPQKHP
jgi:hypothetical protein